MKESEIEQLWYTWSSVGLSGATAGYRVRAASTGLSSAEGLRMRSLDRYLRYQLPFGVNVNTVNLATAPICLALADHGPGERILVHKVLVGRDAVGRPGVFFAHLLAGLPPDFTARDAIELWHSSLWQTQDVSLETQSTILPQLPYNALLRTRENQSIFDFSLMHDAFLCLIKHCLTLKSQQQLRQFYIVGHSEQSAALIWGLTHCLPQQLFSEITFSTYEASVEKSRETIVGTTDLQSVLAAAGKEKIIIDCNAPVPSVRAQQDIEEFAAFAVKCLAQPDSQPPDSVALHELVAEAEQPYNRITNVAEFLAFFKTFTAQRQQKELVDTFVESIRRGDLAQTLSLREKLSRLAPPVNNSELWSDLLQTLSKDESLRTRVMQQWELHKWLLSNMAQAKPLPKNEVISLWLSAEWNNLNELLSLLLLPENWKRSVVRSIISSSIVQQPPPSLLHGLVTNNMSVFAYVLQQLFNKGEEYQQRALQFLKLLVAQKYRYTERLLSEIRGQGVSPDIDMQLQTLLQPPLVSRLAQSSNVPLPQEEERYPLSSQYSSPPISVPTAQQMLVNANSVPVESLSPALSAQSVQQATDKRLPAWRSPRYLALVIVALVLLIVSISFTYYVATTNAQATIQMQVAQTVSVLKTANAKPQLIQGSAYKLIGLFHLPNAPKVGSNFSFQMVLQNMGTSIWSDNGGYSIQCAPDSNTRANDADCQPTRKDNNGKDQPLKIFSGFGSDKVNPDEYYVFNITLKPANGPGIHHVTLLFMDNNTVLGDPIPVSFTAQ